MDEELFNMEIRKYLKKVGVSSQREIEKAVREAIRTGRISGNETLKARMALTIDSLDLRYEIDGDIALS